MTSPNFDKIYQAILEIILPTVDSRNAFGNCTESAQAQSSLEPEKRAQSRNFTIWHKCYDQQLLKSFLDIWSNNTIALSFNLRALQGD